MMYSLHRLPIYSKTTNPTMIDKLLYINFPRYRPRTLFSSHLPLHYLNMELFKF